MSCSRHFLSLHWEHHRWRRRVTGAEIITAEEPDMWARPVLRDYVRCDKQEVCGVCGAVRHEVSCLCDPAKADQCAIYQEWRATHQAG